MKKENIYKNRKKSCLLLIILIESAYGFGIQLPSFITLIMQFFEDSLNPWFQTALYLTYVIPLDFSCQVQAFFYYPQLNFTTLYSLCQTNYSATFKTIWM